VFGPTSDVLAAADVVHARVTAGMHELLRLVLQIERDQLWRAEGARDTAHLLQMRYGISLWQASRWIRAASALETLPRLSRALEMGVLGIDKVLELSRFASPETEERLVVWAQRTSLGVVRAKADAAVRRNRDELLEIERSRSVRTWYFDEGTRFGMEAELPAADGAIVERALERLAARIPAMPDEEDGVYADARRADALVAMASASVAADPDPDRATVVIHAPATALSSTSGDDGPAVHDGPPVSSETLQRLLCTSRFQMVVEDDAANVVALSETARLAPAWMLRQVRYRDRGCRFPGCGAKRFTEAHHIRYWRDGGRTALDNLVLICSFHHRLVHEHGWTIARHPDGGEVVWRRPDALERLRDGPAGAQAQRAG
jgi:hypothetical protein